MALRERRSRSEGRALLLKHCQALHHAVDDGLGACGATGHVHVDGNDLVHAALHVVAVVEDAARAGADAHGHNDLGLDHLLVDLLDDALGLLVDRARDQENVSMLGVARVDDSEALHVVERREARQDLDVAAVAACAVVVDEPRGLACERHVPPPRR